MSDVLSQALWLTVIGMGMTFLSIGALVGGIYLLMYLTRTKERVPSTLPAELATSGTEPLPVGQPATEVPDAESRRRSVAAAVAVAMALAADLPTAPMADSRSMTTGSWNTYVRALHLSSRSHYMSRRRSH